MLWQCGHLGVIGVHRNKRHDGLNSHGLTGRPWSRGCGSWDGSVLHPELGPLFTPADRGDEARGEAILPWVCT